MTAAYPPETKEAARLRSAEARVRELESILQDARGARHNRMELVDDMRARGVKSFRTEGLEVEFFAPEPMPAPEAQQKLKAAEDVEICKCGHPKYQHGDMGCLMGCTDECGKAAEP